MSYQKLLLDIEKGPSKSVYLLHGEELYLMETALKKMKEALVSPHLESLNYQKWQSSELTLDKLMNACETLPFMDERRLVVIQDFPAFQNKKRFGTEAEEERLARYFTQIPASTCLVFYGDQPIDARKKLVKAVGKGGTIVKLERLKEPELQQWIGQFVKAGGKTIGNREVSYLAAHLDYNGRNASQTLLDIAQELQKLMDYAGEGPITLEHIKKIAILPFQNDIFKLLDAVGNRNYAEALKRMEDLLAGGEVAVRLLVTLGNQLRHMLQAKSLLQAGYAPQELGTHMGVHPFVASKAAAQSKYYSEKRLKQLLNQLVEMDYRIKTGLMQERVGIELLLSALCQGG